MSKPEIINVTLPVPGHPLGTDFYICANLEITHWGAPETGRGYMADPMNYDPGCGPEWSCKHAMLFHDCGGVGERVWGMGKELFDHLPEFVESKAMRETVEAALSKIAAETE